MTDWSELMRDAWGDAWQAPPCRQPLPARQRVKRLDAFLRERGISAEEFGRRIGVTKNAVTKYAGGARVPRRRVMAAIVEATGGAVGPDDFFSEVAA